MAVVYNVGQQLPMALQAFDQFGKPMPMPPLDGVPSWTNTTPAVETLAPSSDGMSANATAITAGGDTVSCQLSSGGVSFSASINVTVQAVPSVLTSIEIEPGTPTGPAGGSTTTTQPAG
jgi:hypothetical protein